MISKKMLDAINEQIKLELNSAYIYHGMVAYFEAENYGGMAHWLKVQTHEELNHAQRLSDHVNERGGKVELAALDKPSVDYKDPLDVFKTGLEHEKFITASIHKLYETAKANKDYAAENMLHWFIEEQVEEENNFEYIVTMLERAAGNPGSLMILDSKLGKREG